MVILKMDILSDSEVTKRELITLDAKLLKNSDFYNQIQTLVKVAAASELKPGSNINKIMRTLKYEVKKTWKAQTKKKRAALNSKNTFVNAQLKAIHDAGKVKSLFPRDPISQTHHDRTSKAKTTTKPTQNGACTTCQEKRRMHVTRILGPIVPSEKGRVHY